MAVASGSETTTPDYGLDFPFQVRRWFGRAGWTIAIALAVFFINRSEYPGPALSLLLVLTALAGLFCAVGGVMVWSSRTAKLPLRDRLLDQLELTGEEKVLDVGCGRGLMLIGAAKRLKSSAKGTGGGKATGIDNWSPEVLSDNSIESAKENAKLEGVTDRVRLEKFDQDRLVYPDNNYDVVMSALAIHNFPDEEDRDRIVRELFRVAKPGGKLLILDTEHTGRYAEILRESGAKDVALSPVSFLWCRPTRSVTARK